MEPWIIRECEALVAVWKPPAMHCAPLAGNARRPDGDSPPAAPSLAEWLFALHPECASFPGLRPGEGGLLHRLDSATSGLVLFARSAAAHRAVLDSQAAGLFRKLYAARCRRAPPLAAPEGWDLARWEAALAALHDAANRGANGELGPGVPLPARIRSRFRPYGTGSREVRPVPADSARKAELRAATRDAYETELHGLVLLEPRVTLEARVSLLRGFRHQVRAHLAWIGLPIEGDPLYGTGFRPAQAPRDEGGESRLKLHALGVVLPDPAGNGELRIDAPLPEDWEEGLETT